MSSNISMKNADAACWITILREQKANALLPEDCTAIRRYVEDAATRESVRAIVFTGSGKRAFSAGMDVSAFLAIDASSARAFFVPLKDMLNAVRTAPLPTIAGINGACIGAGTVSPCGAPLRWARTTPWWLSSESGARQVAPLSLFAGVLVRSRR